MAGIPYKVRELNEPEAKHCWISINEDFISDPLIIIDYLRRKFKKNLNKAYSPYELAISHPVRVMLEARWFWHEFRVNSKVVGGRNLDILDNFRRFHGLQFDNNRFKDTSAVKHAFMDYSGENYSREDIIKIMEDDLKAVSKVLGEKLFILGDEPCEDDAAIFGYLAQAVWVDQESDSPFEELLNGDELSNLKSYCIRMKEKFWPDWDQCLKNPNTVESMINRERQSRLYTSRASMYS